MFVDRQLSGQQRTSDEAGAVAAAANNAMESIQKVDGNVSNVFLCRIDQSFPLGRWERRNTSLQKSTFTQVLQRPDRSFFVLAQTIHEKST